MGRNLDVLVLCHTSLVMYSVGYVPFMEVGIGDFFDYSVRLLNFMEGIEFGATPDLGFFYRMYSCM